MNRSSKWLRRVLFVIAIVTGIGSIAAFAGFPLGTLRLIRPTWSDATVLLWDVGLSVLFFLQHSGMTRRRVRARLSESIGADYVPVAYGIASGLALGLLVVLWQPTQTHLYSLVGTPRLCSHALTIAGIALFVWGMRTLKAFDPMGVRPLLGRVRADVPNEVEFAARGAYGLVRHPLYLAVLVLFWATPDIGLDRLLFNVLWTVWTVVGTVLEEADLVAEFGDSYRRYQQAVPMLVPWPKTRTYLETKEQQS